MVYTMERQLVYNAVKCLSCGEVLVSYHRHDYKTCSCQNGTAVDGGVSYQRYGGKDLGLVESLAVYDDAPFEVIREYLHRGGRGEDGKQELKYVALKDINDDWLENLIKYEEELRPNNPYLKFYKQEKEWRILMK